MPPSKKTKKLTGLITIASALVIGALRYAERKMHVVVGPYDALTGRQPVAVYLSNRQLMEFDVETEEPMAEGDYLELAVLVYDHYDEVLDALRTQLVGVYDARQGEFLELLSRRRRHGDT